MMDSKQFTVDMLKSNYKIYIDTCALMKVDCLKQLIKIIENEFATMNKTIIVPSAVLLELFKIKNSPYKNIDDKINASQALEIIGKKSNIFRFYEDGYIDQHQTDYAFADKDLLSILIKNMTKSKQLFITEDGNLSEDVNNLNYLESCKGQKISVCSIGKSGELIEYKSKTHEKYKNYDLKNPDNNVQNSKTDKKPYSILIASFASMIFGTFLGAIGSKIFKQNDKKC